MSFADDLPGIKGIKIDGGAPFVPRTTLRLLGNARVLDNPSLGATDVTVEDTLKWVYAEPAAGTYDNYAIAGFNLATDIMLNPGGTVNITGFAFEGSPNAVFVPVKRVWRDANQDVFLKHQTGSLAEQQFITPGGVDLEIPLNGFSMMVWDPVKRAWRLCKLLGP